MNEQPNPLCDEIRNIARDAPMSKGTRTRLHAIAHDIDKVLATKLGEWKDEGWYDQYAIAGKKLYPFPVAASAPETSQSTSNARTSETDICREHLTAPHPACPVCNPNKTVPELNVSTRELRTSKTNLQRYVAMPFEDSAGNEFPANMEAIDGGEWVRYEDVQHLLRTVPETLGCPHCTEAYRIWETNATVDSVRVLNQMRDAVAVGMFRKVTQEASASETPQSTSKPNTCQHSVRVACVLPWKHEGLCRAAPETSQSTSKEHVDRVMAAARRAIEGKRIAIGSPLHLLEMFIRIVEDRPAPETSDYFGNQIYALLVRRGYAQHEAHLVANGPGCTSDCAQKGYPDVDCPEHGAAQKKERTNQGDSDCVMPGDWPLTAKRPAQETNELFRCKHGACLIDGAGERLEPPCGCRAAQETPAAHIHQFVDGSDPEQQVCTGCDSTRATPEEASPTISLENGKYVFFKDSEGLVSCHRYAEPWRTFLGDKAISCLFEYTWYLQQTLLYTTTQRISDMIRRHVDLRKPSD